MPACARWTSTRHLRSVARFVRESESWPRSRATRWPVQSRCRSRLGQPESAQLRGRLPDIEMGVRVHTGEVVVATSAPRRGPNTVWPFYVFSGGTGCSSSPLFGSLISSIRMSSGIRSGPSGSRSQMSLGGFESFIDSLIGLLL